MVESLPSCRSARCIASSEPRASPSGFSWEATRQRPLSSSAAATAAMSLFSVVTLRALGREVLDQVGQSYAALDRRIVFERQDRRALEVELTRDPRLQHAVC